MWCGNPLRSGGSFATLAGNDQPPIMSYPSVDALQRILVENVFHYAIDKKKAAGRALGTLIEVITFYTLKSWGLRNNICIERPLSEYANSGISHNVEYSLHPVIQQTNFPLSKYALPLTATKLRREIFRANPAPPDLVERATHILSSDGVLRNACTLGENPVGPFIASIDERTPERLLLSIAHLHKHPFAIFECKRVGVEEGQKKGPQTIEKAKQGAYVARSVSALQKVRSTDGSFLGVIQRANGELYIGPYDKLLREIIDSKDPDLLSHFILTVGVVSNHGNWFTKENHNKELKVLAQSYDWLLFLSDRGLADFINELLLSPTPLLEPARKAFLASYAAEKKRNRFTKVSMDVEADIVLQKYFKTHRDRVQGWFNVIAPAQGTLEILQQELVTLHTKNWKEIYHL